MSQPFIEQVFVVTPLTLFDTSQYSPFGVLTQLVAEAELPLLEEVAELELRLLCWAQAKLGSNSVRHRSNRSIVTLPAKRHTETGCMRMAPAAVVRSDFRHVQRTLFRTK